MVPFNLKVLAKIGLCSNCSQKLNGCSLARARKIFATARMLALVNMYSIARDFVNPINKREIPACGKFTKYSKCSLLAISIFLKCSMLAICIF